jgi:hypothetical protein
MLRAVLQAQEEGQLHAEADAKQISFEIHALILALHYEARFLRSPDSVRRALQAFEGIVERYSRAPAAPARTRTSPAAARKSQG